jgi:hypothetical protein
MVIVEERNKGCSGRDRGLSRVYLKICRKEIAYLRFILESYDGVGFIRTVDPVADVVEFNYPPSQAELVAGLLAALAAEVSLEEVACPEGVSPI